MHRILLLAAVFGAWASLSVGATDQQPARADAPLAKQSVPAKSPATRKPSPPRPAPGMIRLYLSMYEAALFLTRYPAPRSTSICGNQLWERRLLGDIKGGSFKVSLKAHRHDPDDGSAKAVPGPARIQVTVLLRSKRMSADYLERLRQWAQSKVREGSPPPPDPENRSEWTEWAVMHMMPGHSVPELEDFDREERRQGRPGQGETWLARTTFDVQPTEQIYTATITGLDTDAKSNDVLILDVSNVEGSACVSTDPDGFSYLDMPETPLADNRADYLNRVLATGGEDSRPKPAAPEPAPGTVRLFLARNEKTWPQNFNALTTIPAAEPSADCALGSFPWSRNLEGDLQGGNFALSLKAETHGYDEPPGKIRASLVHKSKLFEDLQTSSTFSSKEIDRWVLNNARPGAPPPPSPTDQEKWVEWAVRHRKPGAPPIPLLLDTESFGRSRTESAGPPPNPQVGFGETLLASTTFEVTTIPAVLTATLAGTDVNAQAGDVLSLKVENLEGVACIWADPDGLTYVDVPATPLAETPADAINRVYTVTGTLVSKTGAPLPRKTLIFSSAPGLGHYGMGTTSRSTQTVTSRDGARQPMQVIPSSVTTYGQYGPSGSIGMTNPITVTDARGGFSLRIPAKFFSREGNNIHGWIQVGELIPNGYRLAGEAVKVEPPDRTVTQIKLGKVAVKLP